MKNLIFAIYIILSSSTFYVSAQNFFPLNIDNKYQIKNYWHEWGPGGYYDEGTFFNITTVMKDTIINGELFYDIRNNGNHNPFNSNYLFRYDSLDQKLYIKIPGDDTVRLAADFNTATDSHYVSYITGGPKEFISSGLSHEYVLGDSLLVYKIENPFSNTFIYSYFFADKIGIYYFEYADNQNPPFTGYVSEYNVISAIIDSAFINPLVLKIDSLYPVIDRPINTFPYLLSAPYEVSYYQLIDAFHLTLEVERDSSVIFNQNYNVSIYNPHIQINPPDLQVGDIIKLKAVISDASIYNNIDFYPNTGWVSFRVLDPVSINYDNQPLYTYKLEQNYPNPFNPNTIINYEIPNTAFVSLKIFDILGNEVTTLVNEEVPAGIYNAEFYAGNLSSGVYICQLRTQDFIKNIKMILAK